MHCELLVVRQVPAAIGLCTYFQDNILSRHRHLATTRHHETTQSEREQACKQFESDAEVARLYAQLMAQCGVSVQQTHWDRLRLRVGRV